MEKVLTKNIRNVCLLGHSGGGKTSLAEAMLYIAKETDRLGKITEGNTVCDYDPEEVRRGFSLSSSLASLTWRDIRFHILDVPGYFDFEGEMRQCVRVADAAVIVVDGKAGVQVGTEQAWEAATEAGIPKAFFINRFDDGECRFHRAFGALREHFGVTVCPIQIPLIEVDKVIGFVNLIDMVVYTFESATGSYVQSDIPAEFRETCDEYHNMLLESIAQTSEELMEKFFGGEEITTEELKAALRRACLANQIVPVCCGTSYKNKGVQKMLDAVVEYMPAPTDIPAIKGVNPQTGEEDERHPGDDQPFSALAFKIMTDPYVGKLCFFRVYSGLVNKGTNIYNSTKDSSERFGRILQMHANERKDLDTCYCGDIAAVVGVKNTTTGDTFCDENHPIILENMEFPEPVIRVAIEPKTKAGQEKMGIALAKLAEEDPTFRTYTDEETAQTIIAGMGELHLEIIVDRLLREFKVEADVGNPQVAYKETIRKKVDQDTKYARQSGGKGQYGHVKITVEPNEPGKGYEFVNAVVGGAIPKEYIPAVDAGIQGAMQSGVLAGYNVVDVKVTLFDGSYHEVDSSEMAFKIAGSMAFKEAMRKANPVLTEPMMKVSVTVPDDYMGDVIGDLNSRRGQIEGMEPVSGGQQIDSIVPLSEMFGYATALRSRTQGRGVYTMEPSHFAEVPKNIQEEIIKTRGKSNG